MDSLDTSFLSFLKELERCYLYLEKRLRLRVEKWIERLASSGANPSFRRHRNNYTRLLLGMVLKKNLEDPFHQAPPDGQIPPFPAHLKSLLKGIQGPHESVFWRDLYSRLLVQDDNGQMLRFNSAVIQDNQVGKAANGGAAPSSSSSSRGHDKHQHQNHKHQPAALDDSAEVESIFQQSWATILENSENTKYTGNRVPYLSRTTDGAPAALKEMMRDQALRIAFLEAQLSSERIKHGLELSRARPVGLGATAPASTFGRSGLSASFDSSVLSALGPSGSVFGGPGRPETLDTSSFMADNTSGPQLSGVKEDDRFLHMLDGFASELNDLSTS